MGGIAADGDVGKAGDGQGGLDMGEFLDRGVCLHIIVMTMMMMVWGYIWH
jgi:hypothetical protein